MSLIDHRLQAPVGVPEVRCFDCPEFSSFRYIQDHFPGAGRPIHRAFSLSRMAECHVLVSEQIQSVGLLKSNDDELASMGGRPLDAIYRLSFWRTPYRNGMSVLDLKPEHLFGYVILKHDEGLALGEFGEFKISRWYVFEGVFQEERKRTSFVTHEMPYHLCVGGRLFEIRGVLYCQQNGINKVCAHVALRTLLSRMSKEEDVDNKEINDLARTARPEKEFDPRGGFDQLNTRKVLEGFGVSSYSYSYLASDQNADTKVPYQAYVYAGVEAGFGSLLHFKFKPNDKDGHVIPVYGHTFNRQTWVPDAEMSYFMLSKNDGYIRSDSWTSNFLAHDDNFGSNYCIPRKQIASENVFEVTVLQEPGVRMIGPIVEAAVKHILDLWVPKIDVCNLWNRQIVKLGDGGVRMVRTAVVLRTVVTDRESYLLSLGDSGDGQGNKEDEIAINRLNNIGLPEKMMMVEVSLPQLFPANKRRIGEFLFDASINAGSTVDGVVASSFIFARMPGSYLIAERKEGSATKGNFYRSHLTDHVRLYRT